MSRSRSAALGVISSQLFLVVTMMANLVAVPLVLKFLTKEGYGLWILLSQTIGYLGMLDFGLTTGVSRYLAMHRQTEESTALNRIVSTSFYSYLALGAFVIAGSIIFAPWVPKLLNAQHQGPEIVQALFIALGIWTGVQFPARAVVGLFFAHQRQALANMLGFIFGNLSLALSLLLLALGYDLWSFVYSNVVTATLHLGTSIFLVRKHYPEMRVSWRFFDLSVLKQMYAYGFFLFLNGIAWTVVAGTDRLLIGSLVSISAVTTFALTARLAEIAMQLIFRVSDNAFPLMVEVSTHEGIAKFRRVHHRLMTTTVSLACVAFWAILILDEWFLRLWVGPGFFAGRQVLLITCVLMAYHSCLHVSATCLNGAGYVKGFSLFSVGEAILNLVLSIWLGQRFGVFGIIGATLLAGVLTSGWYTPRLAMRYMNIPFREYVTEPILRPIFIVSLAGVALYLLSHLVLDARSSNWMVFGGFALLAGIILFGAAWIGILRKELAPYVPVRLHRLLGVAGAQL